MISRQLHVAIQEAIQEHADKHHGGVLDMERILSALGEVSAAYLAELPDTKQPQLIFNQLCIGIASSVNSKAAQQIVRVGYLN